MRGRGWALLAAVGLALGPGGTAYAAADEGVRVEVGAWRYPAGAQLSDGTADARLPVRIGWTQQAPEGYCEQLLQFEDSQGVRDEDVRFDGVDGRDSWTVSMPAQGSAHFSLYTIPCGDHADLLVSDARTTRLVQEQSVQRSPGWQRRACACLSGGSAVVSREGGVRAHAALTGRSVALVASTGPTAGQADVYVDGVHAGTVDATRADVRRRVVVFQRHWAAAGEHRVTVVPRTAGFVLDALVVAE